MLTVGIDEVGYGPKFGPLVVAAVAAAGPLPLGIRIADSKRIFSQARGVSSLEPAVLGFVPAATFAELLERLAIPPLPAPWYAAPLALPSVPRAGRLEAARAAFVETSDFNAAATRVNKSEILFETAAGLIRDLRRDHPGPIRFVVGKQGGRRFYRKGLERLVAEPVETVEESRGRSAYRIPGAEIEFLVDAEDRHELVALASMVGKYVRECAMKLFNDWWAARIEGLRRTAGYGLDARRFWKDIRPHLDGLGVHPDAVLRLR